MFMDNIVPKVGFMLLVSIFFWASCDSLLFDDDSGSGNGDNLSADFVSDRTQIKREGKIQFSSTSTGEIKGLRWVFTGGDPTVSTEENPVVQYFEPGEYKVSLTIEDFNNNYDVEIKESFIIVTGAAAVECPATVTDYEGRVYNVVQIGNQCWMAENLRTGYLNDGTRIPQHELQKTTGESEGWESATEPAMSTSPEFDNSYSRIYNGYAALSGKLCPEGWHIPTFEELIVLRDTLGGSRGDAGHALKGTRFWSDNSKATNTSGFTAYPTVSRRENGYFNVQGIFGGTWQSSTAYWTVAWPKNASWDSGAGIMILEDDDDDIDTQRENILNRGYACRCVKD